jgi:hypothetical protein
MVAGAQIVRTQLLNENATNAGAKS